MRNYIAKHLRTSGLYNHKVVKDSTIYDRKLHQDFLDEFDPLPYTEEELEDQHKEQSSGI